ncbi:hypothetical protein [Polyangium sp. y55x31]|uniref:hypothetical protein n=1 Tax=Polyangium sp. y55x31 TaxID=3042688 RepID=UPI00248267CC|nr:hypothetical protein [Polyangium sp. y55x31]MDI1483630.1 hypothetical protein [Polyangium sp. y55x31]
MEQRKRRNGPLELVTWLLRTGAPAALEGMGLGFMGGLLQEHEPVLDGMTARSALDLVRIVRASVDALSLAVDERRQADGARAMDDALGVLGLADAALVAALAYALGAGAKTGEEIQDACLRVQTIASRWGKDVPPPTLPSATESQRERGTAPSRRTGARRGTPSSKGQKGETKRMGARG